MHGDLGWLSKRSPRFLGLARVLAWGAGYGGALLVAYAYPSLPDELALSRWTLAPKSMFFALRVPLINLASIGLCEVLARVLGRAPVEQRHVGEWAGAALLCTAGIKALLGALEIIRWPPSRASNAVASFVIVGVGFSLAAWFAQPLLGSGAWRTLRSTRLESVIGAALLLAIALLNLPLITPSVVPGWLR